MNPFKYGCVVTGPNFCPRPLLERQLRQCARDGQNVVIQGERRIGKTSLVRHALEGMKDVKLVYVDLFAIRSMSDLCHRTAEGLGALSNDLNFVRKVVAFISSLRPTLSLDPQTGNPSLSVDVRAANEPQSLQVIMTAIEKVAAERKICVVFDEFQDVLRIDNGEQVLAELRSRIQFQSDIAHFFMGSIRNEMLGIFTSPESPFFKSAMPFEVSAIDETAFCNFIIRRFKAGKRSIDKATALSIIRFAAGVSGDVQELCKAICDTTEEGAVIGEKDVPNALETIFEHELRGYDDTIERLTPIQLTTLRTLAKTGNSEVCGKRFLEDAALTNPSVVRRAMTKLTSERIVYLHKGVYRFTNPFFREWLSRNR